MIRVRIKIGTEQSDVIHDSTDYGLVYLDSDKRVGRDLRDFEVTTYPEQDGENILPKTTNAPFDYKVKFFIQSTDLKNANEIIDEFNSNLYTVNNDVKTYKKVTFYNDYKGHKIVGYPKEIASATEFWRDKRNQAFDVVVVEWQIRVNSPSECEFKKPFTDDSGN